MPQARTQDETPKELKPYIFHGIDLANRIGSKEWEGDCPFCGRAGKFTVNEDTGQYRCYVCADGTDKGGGNASVFIKRLWEMSDEATGDYSDLDDRGIDFITLAQWGICKSVITGEWLVPLYGEDGLIKQLHKWVWQGQRRAFYPTPGLGAYLFGMQHWVGDRTKVYLAEGLWDAMILWEAMNGAKEQDGKLVHASASSSLLTDANILAVPNCGSVGEPFRRWCHLFAGKRVCLLFDNDHSKKLCPKCKKSWSVTVSENCPICGGSKGKDVEPAGWAATKRAARILSEAKQPPASIEFLEWQAGKSYNGGMVDGCDVRDVLTKSQEAWSGAY